jgi:hypothetical protein
MFAMEFRSLFFLWETTDSGATGLAVGRFHVPIPEPEFITSFICIIIYY